MKVAIIQEHVNVRRGGAETSVLEMAAALSALGLEVTVVCAASPGESSCSCTGVRIAALDVSGRSKLARTVRFVSAADQHCLLGCYDIVHAVTPCLAANIYQPRGGTYVETVARSVALARTPWGRLLKRIGRRLNRRQRFLLLLERTMLTAGESLHVAAVSEYVRRQVLEQFDFPQERAHVVFNGVDFSFIDALQRRGVDHERAGFLGRLGIPNQADVILFVAHNFRLKGLTEALCALARMRSASPLVVAGRGDPRPYRRLARALGLADRCHFVGDDVPAATLYASTDLLLHPTWYDPCSRVVLEALGAGIPVVTTRFNGAAEAIESGRNGVVVDHPADSEGLARGIEECTTESVRYACRAAAPSMRRKLSMARHAQELVELYRRVLKTRRA